MTTSSFSKQFSEFADYLEPWLETLQTLSLGELCSEPEKVAVLSVDLIKGFCNQGPLAGPRCAGIVPGVVDLFKQTYKMGVRSFALLQDAHSPQAVEFNTWPAHCVAGTEESDTVDEFHSLPFFDEISILHKNSIDAFEYTTLDLWVNQVPQVTTFVVTGDCTDLCVYQLAMHLRTKADARDLQRRVIVPADLVQTYDFPVPAAKPVGAMPHPGDLMHACFLYHMALNGIEVVHLK